MNHFFVHHPCGVGQCLSFWKAMKGDTVLPVMVSQRWSWMVTYLTERGEDSWSCPSLYVQEYGLYKVVLYYPMYSFLRTTTIWGWKLYTNYFSISAYTRALSPSFSEDIFFHTHSNHLCTRQVFWDVKPSEICPFHLFRKDYTEWYSGRKTSG